MPSNRIRTFLVAITLILALSTVVLSWMVASSDDAAERTLRHDVAWTAANARVEAADLTRAILEKSKDSTRVALDVLKSRVDTWRSGLFRVFAAENTARRARVEAVAAILGALERPLAALDTPSERETAIALADRLAALIDRLAGEAMEYSNRELAANWAHFDSIERAEHIVMGLLLVCGFTLIILTSRQNNRLRELGLSERATAERFEHLAAHDPLTELPNRASFRTACELALAATQPTEDGRPSPSAPVNGRPALLVLDLDGFKLINDAFGHKFGDEVLCKAADRLRSVFGDHVCSKIARLGGDEFAVLLPCSSGLTEALSHAERLHQALRDSYVVDGIPLMVDVSIGIAEADMPGMTVDRLTHCADLALNQAKARGKGQILVYTPEMDVEILKRQEMEADFARAVAAQEFEPFYQPVTNLATGEIIAVEALARWRHPQRGFISPKDFIPAAEASGHIVEIGRIILEKACRDAAALSRPLPVAVNLSTVQLMRVDVPMMVADILQRTGLPAHRLKLEITESVLITDETRTRDMMDRMHAMGVTVSLDDFGTGYSSLSYLSGYGFDELKIDRSFISELENDPRSLAIVQTIVALGHRLGLNTVAEGIETHEQAALVMACGCSRGQGYLYSAPIAIAELKSLIAPASEPSTKVA